MCVRVFIYNRVILIFVDRGLLTTGLFREKLGKHIFRAAANQIRNKARGTKSHRMGVFVQAKRKQVRNRGNAKYRKNDFLYLSPHLS